MPDQFPYQRIAIVNRGEAAIRFIQAVRDFNCERGLSLETVAFYTEPDTDAVYVQKADHVANLGSAWFSDKSDLDENGVPSRKSRYLSFKILEKAIRETGCDAAWCGWGFVAELPEFPELCTKLGIVCIGPSASSMRLLGDKIASKQLAERTGVDVGDWSGGPVENITEALRHAERIGYPLLVKATAGGGGRGIRIVRQADELEKAFTSAREESAKSFGNATVLIERMLVGARHVEVQIAADNYGVIWAFGVRDCSIQRRHQKVIEEGPSPALSTEREKMLKDQAEVLARAADYRSVGTVEFLYHEATDRAAFLEMNTRLQVEHPVTEMTTGVDLVKLQIAIAAGERLPAESPPTIGHAIEARVNAEDPHQGFAPSPGTLLRFRPGTGPGIRTDSGVREGDAIPGEFDSMIAKIIAYGRDREEARARLERALEDSHIVIENGASNKNHLISILRHPDFKSSKIHTKWLDEKYASGELLLQPDADAALLVAAIDVYEKKLRDFQVNFFTQAKRGTPELPQRAPQYTIEMTYMGNAYRFLVGKISSGLYRITIDDQRIEIRLDRGGKYLGRLHYAGRKHQVCSISQSTQSRIEVKGNSYLISLDPGGTVRAPSPA
ncbi:ATP-grasp domain-containing protein, partial [bacterium]|nr:ATP-grasp domain-containing protein [bacterium]